MCSEPSLCQAFISPCNMIYIRSDKIGNQKQQLAIIECVG